MAEIDANTKNVGLGYVHGTGDMVLPLKVNPLNNKLRIEIVPLPIGTGVVQGNIKIDANDRNIGAGVTNDSNQIITNLTADDVVGFPCLRIEI